MGSEMCIRDRIWNIQPSQLNLVRGVRMARDYPELVKWGSALKGFLSGGLISGGLFLNLNLLIQALFFIAGVIIFLESIFPRDEAFHGVTVATFLLLGAFITIGVSSIGFGIFYLFFLLMISFLVYMDKLKTLAKKLKPVE